jgi:DNA-binding FadR family transcriptional regulator
VRLYLDINKEDHEGLFQAFCERRPKVAELIARRHGKEMVKVLAQLAPAAEPQARPA